MRFFLVYFCARRPASAQDYPTKTVRLIVPLSPGAGADVAARLVAARMSEHWKQPVIVENRPGAGGQIGTAAVVKAEPDEHTLLAVVLARRESAIYRNLPYDPQKDLVDVAIVGKTPYVMVSSASGPYRSLKALFDAARAKPGEIAYSSAGSAPPPRRGISHRPRRRAHDPRAVQGLAEALQDVLGGRSAFYMAPVNVALGLVKDGKLVPLGVSTRSRAAVLPDVPTLAGQGLHRLRGDALVRNVGAGRDAGRRSAEAERRDERHRPGAGDARAVLQARHAARADEARGVRALRA